RRRRTDSDTSRERKYGISLEEDNQQTREALARQQGDAEGKQQVLRSFGEAATRLRKELGESLSSIQKFAAPLDQATTSSLEALKAYSLAHEQNFRGNYAESNSLLKHATELDPNFASAYGDMAINYSA